MLVFGCFVFGIEYVEFYDILKLGVIMIKVVIKEVRFGNLILRVVEILSGMLNVIGL